MRTEFKKNFQDHIVFVSPFEIRRGVTLWTNTSGFQLFLGTILNERVCGLFQIVGIASKGYALRARFAAAERGAETPDSETGSHPTRRTMTPVQSLKVLFVVVVVVVVVVVAVVVLRARPEISKTRCATLEDPRSNTCVRYKNHLR